MGPQAAVRRALRVPAGRLRSGQCLWPRLLRRRGALDKVHAPLFRAVHDQRLLANNATIDEIAWFLGQHGLDAAAAKAAMASPEVDAQMQRARDFQLAIRLRGTPTLVVDGRYVVTPSTHQDALRIAEQLVGRLRSGDLPRAR